jgi:hypothetical protein
MQPAMSLHPSSSDLGGEAALSKPLRAVVAIPVRNEAERIGECRPEFHIGQRRAPAVGCDTSFAS